MSDAPSIHNPDPLELMLARARQKLHLAKNDVDAAERASQYDPEGFDQKLLASAVSRYGTAKAEFDGLNNQSAAAGKAKRDAERAARLAEADVLEMRARELRALCD